MRIAIVQHDIRCPDAEGNLRHLETLLDRKPGADLYVLSETFATGFLAEGAAEEAGVLAPRILQWMQAQARRRSLCQFGKNAYIYGTLLSYRHGTTQIPLRNLPVPRPL